MRVTLNQKLTPTKWVLTSIARHSSSRSQQGFNLLELIVALGVMAIITSFAVPAFQSMTAKSRAASLANTFVTMVHFARSEAIKRSAFVSICAANATQTGCAGTNWANGWIVFADANGDGVYSSATDTILRTQTALPTGTTITSTPATAKIIFQNNGFIKAGSGNGSATYTLKPSGCTGATGGRQVVVSSTGHPSMSNISCP